MSDGLERLAAAVQERRALLGLLQKDMELRGGPSEGTVRNIEQVARTTYSLRTFRALERALGWTPGSVDCVLAGGTPLDSPEGELAAVQLGHRRAPWRVGRKLGRTIYERVFTDRASDDDRFLGLMDDRRDAELVVALHNAHPDALPELGPSWESPLRAEAVWSAVVRWAVHAHRATQKVTVTTEAPLAPEDARKLGIALVSAHRWLAQP